MRKSATISAENVIVEKGRPVFRYCEFTVSVETALDP